MKTKIVLLTLIFTMPPLFANGFGPFLAQGDMDTLLAQYPVMRPELERLFFSMSGNSAQTREFAEMVDHSSQLMEAFLFWTNGPVISAGEFSGAFQDIVSRPKPAEMQELFSKYSLGSNGFGKFYLTTTTTLILYTRQYFAEEKAKLPSGSEEYLYLEQKLASIDAFLADIHPGDLDQIQKSSLSIIRIMM
ncbi:MAG: hypothetical protein LBK64_08295 [Spirochaetaceae bacterium]|jgi:hypothetical protein|nr:hypothetical protein [Spirochaetaceae bacterium]